MTFISQSSASRNTNLPSAVRREMRREQSTTFNVASYPGQHIRRSLGSKLDRLNRLSISLSQVSGSVSKMASIGIGVTMKLSILTFQRSKRLIEELAGHSEQSRREYAARG